MVVKTTPTPQKQEFQKKTMALEYAALLIVMKRVELKRIAEALWKSSPDEKTPFATHGILPDNGSFSKTLDSEDIKKPKEFLDSEDELSQPMSIPRKLCFVMSFNVWILYFLVLGWWIPCRQLECGLPSPDIVETNLSSIWLLTNVETINVIGLPSLAMIGFGDGTELKVGALDTSESTFAWNNSLPFIPKKIQCHFETTFDVNRDGVADCLLSGFNDMYAFNASNGYLFWHQNIPSEEGNILSGFHPANARNGENFLFGTCGDKLVVVNARNGSKIFDVSLPCESPSEIKIVPNAIKDNFTIWRLVCDYGDQIEVWSFDEQDMLNVRKSEKRSNASNFTLLFNGANSGGSIDLGCDVMPVPGGPILLSWADRVVMVTQEAIAWERHFPEPLTVASIKVGYFSKTKDLFVAAAVNNYTNAIIYIMELKNGTILDSVMLKGRQARYIEKIVDDIDLLVLQSLSFNYTIQYVYNITDPVPVEQTNFALVDFSSGKLKVEDITTTSIVAGFTLNMKRNGETDLLVIKTENGLTTYQKYILHDIDSQDLCLGSIHRHHYSFET